MTGADDICFFLCTRDTLYAYDRRDGHHIKFFFRTPYYPWGRRTISGIRKICWQSLKSRPIRFNAARRSPFNHCVGILNKKTILPEVAWCRPSKSFKILIYIWGRYQVLKFRICNSQTKLGSNANNFAGFGQRDLDFCMVRLVLLSL